MLNNKFCIIFYLRVPTKLLYEYIKVHGDVLMSMLGLTKKQFLKRSKECLDAQGIHLLNINELLHLESDGRISKTESYKRIRAVMKDLDIVFQRYQKLVPPSNCVETKLEILNSIVLLQEAATAIYDSTHTVTTKEEQEFDKTKLKESQILLDNFRRVFQPLTKEIDGLFNV